MITAKEFCEKVMIPVNEKWGYIWGKRGQVWTKEEQENATRDTTRLYGAKWIGKRVCDCSGLVTWAAGELGLQVYHGSNTQYLKECGEKGRLKHGMREDQKPLVPGSLVFLLENGVRHHVGVYLGGGMAAEAKSTAAGVVVSPASRFDEWGELSGVDHSTAAEPFAREAVKKGSAGYAVKEMQQRLSALGFDCGTADGLCGEKTLAALIRFQQSAGLNADGICGPDTWQALTDAEGSAEKESAPESAPTEDTPARLTALAEELGVIASALRGLAGKTNEKEE